MAFWCTIISVWKFSPPISCVIQHPAVVPHIWLLSHSTIISLLWHLCLNQVLKCYYVIIQSHMSLKLLILLRIMSPLKGTLSIPSFANHMIIKVFITPKNPFFHSSSICPQLMFHWVSLPTHIGYWCKLNQHHSFCSLSSSSICFHSNCLTPHFTWLSQPKNSWMLHSK